jgi:hypothetical protein
MFFFLPGSEVVLLDGIFLAHRQILSENALSEINLEVIPGRCQFFNL